MALSDALCATLRRRSARKKAPALGNGLVTLLQLCESLRQNAKISDKINPTVSRTFKSRWSLLAPLFARQTMPEIRQSGNLSRLYRESCSQKLGQKHTITIHQRTVCCANVPMYKISRDTIIVNLKFGPDFSFILFMFCFVFLLSVSLCCFCTLRDLAAQHSFPLELIKGVYFIQDFFFSAFTQQLTVERDWRCCEKARRTASKTKQGGCCDH